MNKQNTAKQEGYIFTFYKVVSYFTILILPHSPPYFSALVLFTTRICSLCFSLQFSFPHLHLCFRHTCLPLVSLFLSPSLLSWFSPPAAEFYKVAKKHRYRVLDLPTCDSIFQQQVCRVWTSLSSELWLSSLPPVAFVALDSTLVFPLFSRGHPMSVLLCDRLLDQVMLRKKCPILLLTHLIMILFLIFTKPSFHICVYKVCIIFPHF